MDEDKIIGLQRAAEIAGVSHMAIKDWCQIYGIGEKVGHQWHIDTAKLDTVVKAREHLRLLKTS